MDVSYRDFLEKIHEELRRYGDFVPPPATAEQVERLRRRLREELGTDLPDAYATFLTLSDGLSWNGLTIFGCENRSLGSGRRAWVLDGCVEVNLIYREAPGFDHFLLFGGADIDFYARDNQTDLYHMIDRVGQNTYETFDSFDSLITETLRRRWES